MEILVRTTPADREVDNGQLVAGHLVHGVHLRPSARDRPGTDPIDPREIVSALTFDSRLTPAGATRSV
jgi:hypothetical protein